MHTGGVVQCAARFVAHIVLFWLTLAVLPQSATAQGSARILVTATVVSVPAPPDEIKAGVDRQLARIAMGKDVSKEEAVGPSRHGVVIRTEWLRHQPVTTPREPEPTRRAIREATHDRLLVVVEYTAN